MHMIRHSHLVQRALDFQNIRMKTWKLVLAAADIGAFFLLTTRSREMAVAEAEVREQFGFRMRELSNLIDGDAQLESRGGAVHAQLAGADTDHVSMQIGGQAHHRED